MNLIGLMPVRNEDWVVGLSARVALLWCDALIVLEHACTDRSAEILEEIRAENPGRLQILREPDSLWAEMAHRQRLLDAARAWKATHVAIVDADEVLTANAVPHVRPVIERLAPCQYLATRMFAMWRGIETYRDDTSVWSNRTDLVLGFADSPELFWRRSADGYDHHHRHPFGSRCGGFWPSRGGVMHLQFADWRRLAAKHALYKMVERIRWPNRNVRQIDHLYSMALDERGLRTTAMPAEYLAGYGHLLPHLHLGQEPWQEAECRRLWMQHGAENFEGLNLFGVLEEASCAAK